MRARVAELSGGKSHRRGGDQAFKVVPHCGLVAFDGQEVIGPVFQHQGAGGLGLRVEGVETDDAALHVQPCKEFARGGDFVALVRDHDAAEVMLAGHGDGGEHALAPGVVGFFAVEHDEFGGRRRTARLALKGQGGRFDGPRIDPGVEAAEGGLAGCGVFACGGVGTDAQAAALALAQATGEGGEVLLPARGVGQVRGGDDGQQRPQRISPNPGAIVRHGLEVLAEGLQLGGGLGGPGWGLGGHGRQRGPQLFGLQTAARVFAKLPAEEALGLVVPHVEVTGVPAGAIGLAQLGPAAGGVKGAGEMGGIDEGLDHEDRMAVAGQPVGRESGQHQPQGFGGEVGEGFIGQQEIAGVIDDQRQPPAALFLGPAEPLVAGAQAACGGTEDQHAEPVAVGIGEGIVEALADGFETAQIVMLIQQRGAAGQFVGLQQTDLDAIEQVLLCGRGEAGAWAHIRRG